MKIQRYVQKALEGLYAFDCKYRFFYDFRITRMERFYFHPDNAPHEIRFQHQQAINNYWNTLYEGRHVATMECYFLDWYKSNSYRVEVIDAFLSELEEKVEANLPQKPEDSFPDQICLEKPTESGVLVRIILRRLYTEMPEIREKASKDILADSKAPLLKVIRKMKTDFELDKVVRQTDESARLSMLTGLKSFDKRITKAKLYHIAKTAALIATAYNVLRCFGLIKHTPFTSSNLQKLNIAPKIPALPQADTVVEMIEKVGEKVTEKAADYIPDICPYIPWSDWN